AKNREPIRVVDDIITSPTFAHDCAGAIWKILGSEMPFGIYHAANSGHCSWHEFAQHIVNAAGLHAEVARIRHTDYPSKARRPLWSVLGTTNNLDLRHWKKAVEEYIITEGAGK
ncbi:MAG: sugar nucleotide-binding protein, partial [Nitrospiraceae bacterium]|nr:sugar nucleotide-binding protein [Nitrospiraceae bacterium]